MSRIDIALRALLMLAGVLAAAVLTLKGQGQALPPLALGATLGVVMMTRLDQHEE